MEKALQEVENGTIFFLNVFLFTLVSADKFITASCWGRMRRRKGSNGGGEQVGYS